MIRNFIQSKSRQELIEIIANFTKYEEDFVLESFLEIERRFLKRKWNSKNYISLFHDFLKTKRLASLTKLSSQLNEVDSPHLLECLNTLVKSKEEEQNSQSIRKISKIQYAGFGPRLGANLIDVILFIPVIFLGLWVMTISPILFVVVQIILQFIFPLYILYYHAKYGATIGKKAVSIKVVKVDLSAISWKEAFLRSSIDILISVVRVAAILITITSIPREVLSDIGMLHIEAELKQYPPYLINYVDLFSQLWFWSEVIVLLFNKRRRAIHDFIAGTVVIKDYSV